MCVSVPLTIVECASTGINVTIDDHIIPEHRHGLQYMMSANYLSMPIFPTESVHANQFRLTHGKLLAKIERDCKIGRNVDSWFSDSQYVVLVNIIITKL